jgi:DNA helicase-4
MQILNSLNEKQKNAVLSENKRILVLAGAGSGKTKTVIAKLLHLVVDKKVKPTSVLAITFTKNAANEMIDRLIVSSDDTSEYEDFISSKTNTNAQKEEKRREKIKSDSWISKLTIRTIHSLCYKILRENGNSVFDSKFKLIVDDGSASGDFSKLLTVCDEKPKDILHKSLIELCSHRNFILGLKRYILDYYVNAEKVGKEFTEKSYDQKRTYTTLNNEEVKSKSERDIADWLFRHNIKYVYEPKVNFSDFEFRPDFHIPQADLFLEHVSNLSHPMGDKEWQFQKGGRNFVKTYEALMNNSSLFNLAMDRIVKGKITENISEGVALNFEEEFKNYHDKIDKFLRDVNRLMSMMKSEDIDTNLLLEKAAKNPHERVRMFYELAIPIINKYSSYCIDKSYMDFDDLVHHTITLLETNQVIRSHYQSVFKYIMVDEFQDVNSLQVKLLNLLTSNESQLFCVGDDWQSIYGFRGSDVSFILNFENQYENAEVHKLDINYRSNQTIVGASNEVIKNNKNQLLKDVSAFNKAPSKIELYSAKIIKEDGVDFLVQKVSELYNKGLGKDDILVLYRRSKMFDPFFQKLKENNLQVSSKTIHASKGLEAKAVFIIGLTEGSGGFPDIWLDDAIFKVVKDLQRDVLLEEERRLFYVAMTRAKDELYLITELGNESSFVEEIPLSFFTLHKPSFKDIIDAIPNCDNCKSVIDSKFPFCPFCGMSQVLLVNPSKSLKKSDLSSNDLNERRLKRKEHSEKIEKARLQNKNAYRKWTANDDEVLIQMFQNKKSISDMCAHFDRTSYAITSRIEKLELEKEDELPL